MRAKANLPEPTARAEVARYCAWPTQASSYLAGCLEILAIRERYFARTGRADTATLRAFHDRLAGSGGLPPALAEQALDLRGGLGRPPRCPPSEARAKPAPGA